MERLGKDVRVFWVFVRMTPAALFNPLEVCRESLGGELEINRRDFGTVTERKQLQPHVRDSLMEVSDSVQQVFTI